MQTAAAIKQQLQALSNEEKRKVLVRFFKTGKGQYGEGDLFLGVTVPQQRALVKQCGRLSLPQIELLLHDSHHECRLTALFFLIKNFKSDKQPDVRQQYVDFYLKNIDFINNWDLVDLSAPDIVGEWLLSQQNRAEKLQLWATSEHLWLQRIAIVATVKLIRAGQFGDTLAVAKLLLHHQHDLIQKATGWMLREIGKRDFSVEYDFLIENNRYKTMPRTMLRYAIERFPEEIRLKFLNGFA